MVALTGMISFYDEDPAWVYSSVRDLMLLGVTRIVAVDGAYELYPGGTARSRRETIDALCGHNVDLLFYQPRETWCGNEVQKRQFMLDQAIACSETWVDWLVVWDADYQLVDAPSLLRLPGVIKQSLTDCDKDFASVSFSESAENNGWHPLRIFMRAQPGMRMDGNHHTYLTPSGHRSQILERPVPLAAGALDLGSIKVKHRVHERDPERRAKQTTYYERRDAAGEES